MLSVFDEIEFEINLSDEEIENFSGKTSIFTHEDVLTAEKCVLATGLLGNISAWRAEDKASKHPGGPARYVDDRAILIVLTLLAREHSPLNLTEMGAVLHRRLTAASRKHLNLPTSLPRKSGGGTEKKNWFNHASNSFHRVLDTMDPHLDTRGTRNRLLSNAEREEIFSARDRNTMRRRKERLDLFSELWLDMTFRMQPRRLRRLQKTAHLSVDQTPVRAVSQKGTRKDRKTGAALERKVLEIDADWYVKGEDWIWGFAANIFVNTAPTPGAKAQVPITIRALSLSKPNEDIPGETVKLAKQLVDRGHTPGRLTADRGYYANSNANDLQIPVRQLGFDPVMDFKRDQLGLQEGGQNGSIFVEGEHLCPATPRGLVNASKRALDLEFDEGTYRKLIDERAHYALRNKERPDENGKVKKMCPAYGPQATVECPLREIHPNSSAKSKPRVLKSNLPAKPAQICCQSSVVFTETVETAKFAQSLRYGSREWAETYKFDRNSIEGINGYIKHSANEALDSPQRRSVRGLAAQQVFVTMLAVSVNMRKLASFLAEEGREIIHRVEQRYPVSRRRDRENIGNYKRKWGPKQSDVIVDGRSEPLRT